MPDRYSARRPTERRAGREHRGAAFVARATSIALVALLTSGALATAGPSDGLRDPHVGHAASTLNATDTAHLRYLHSSGSLLVETGEASGTLPGTMQAHVDVGQTLSGDFTIDVRSGGTIEGHGTATSHGSGTYESFRGTLIVTGGSGRYVHAHGRAGLYGTFDRRTYALTVQTTGRLAY
jgi:hypothetical protein